MRKEQLRITKEDFVSWYTPRPAFALIEKDVPAERIGQLQLPESVRNMGAKYAGTGIIRCLSPVEAYEDPFIEELAKIYKVGDRVSFSTTTPHNIDIPSFCTFDSKVKFDMAMLVLIHIADIFGVIRIPEERLSG